MRGFDIRGWRGILQFWRMGSLWGFGFCLFWIGSAWAWANPVFNEVVSSNAQSYFDEDGDSPDWIELHNPGDDPIDLEGWGLSDDDKRPYRWIFPQVLLPGHSYRVLFASGKDRRDPNQELHLSFQLKASGETLILSDPEDRVQDRVVLPELREDVSFGRWPNASGEWSYQFPTTPRRPNRSVGIYSSIVLHPPLLSQNSGAYQNPFFLGMDTAESGVEIRYSLDGSEPTKDSTLYEGPLLLEDPSPRPNHWSMIEGTSTANQHTDGWKAPLGLVRKAIVIRARGFRQGGLDGPESVGTFFIGSGWDPNSGIPTLSLQSDPMGLFDYRQGIYMLGAVFDDYVSKHPDEPLTGHTPANYTQRGKAWERSGHLQWFTAGGIQEWQEPVVLDIKGQSSRSFRQKSFGLKAQGIESPRNRFQGELFPGLQTLGGNGPLLEFKNLRLRNLGNDWDYAFMRDDWCHRISEGLGLHLMASRYVNVFLNGEYWGILSLREEQNSEYFQMHYGIPDDEIVILSGPGNVEEGRQADGQTWRDLLTYCENHIPLDQVAYEELVKQVDPVDALHYFLAQIYFANADWPQNNIRVWRRSLETPNPSLGPGWDGRWRWMLFDLDLGAGHPWSTGFQENTLAVALSPTGRSGFTSGWGTAVFRALISYPPWKEQFLNTAADLLNSHYSAKNAVEWVDQMKAELLPSMPEHIRRWRSNGGTLAAWEIRVRALRDFALQRTTYLRRHLVSELHPEGTLRLTLNTSNPDAGILRINGMEIHAGLPGVREGVYPWLGNYFKGVPITIEAILRPGFRFSQWEGLDSTGANLRIVLDGDQSVTALFVPDLPRIEWVMKSSEGDVWRITGAPRARYEWQRSDNLREWEKVDELEANESGTIEVDVQESNRTGSATFFRAVLK